MVMDKNTFTRFIDKYHLSGNVNSVVLEISDNTLSTRFITGDKSLLGELTLENWNFGNSEFGVYNTDQLVRLLGVLSDNITLEHKESGDKVVSLKVSDDNASVNFMLSDLSVINRPPDLKKLPEFQVQIKVDSTFINKFIAGKNALPDTDYFAVLTDDVGVKLVIGYAEINTNHVTLPVSTETYDVIDTIFFNADLFREVLSANKECESATFEVSDQGLSRINFKVDDYDATYYLVAIQDPV
jgi:hypothetical protein